MKGVIAASHPRTVEAGVEILERGGNAVDAAVAAAFASFAAEPVLTSIGGSGIATVFDVRSGEPVYYDFFSNMPSGQPAEGMDFRKITVDFGPATQDFFIGRASVAVPGAVAGLCMMAEQMGTMSLQELASPAIRMARSGVRLSKFLAYTLGLLEPIFTYTPEIAGIFAPGGHLLGEGEKVCLKGLGDLMENISIEGPRVFYEGYAAEALVEDQKERGGLITESDMSGYKARSSEPIVVEYHGYTVVLPSAPSSGGALIAFSLGVLDLMDVGRYGFLSPQHLQILADVMRVTNDARTELKLSPDGIAEFVSRENVDRYAERLLRPGDRALENGRGSLAGNTTHISVIDGSGMAVGVTTTAGEAAGYVVKGTGVIPNNMLGEVDLHPRGFHRLPPGTRLETMTAPAILLKDGVPVLAVGSGGSNRIRSAILQVISNVVDFHLPLGEAIDAPRVHFEGGILQAEGGIPKHTLQVLADRGYKVNAWGKKDMFFGGANAVGITSDWEPVAAGDGRRGGTTAVVL